MTFVISRSLQFIHRSPVTSPFSSVAFKSFYFQFTSYLLKLHSILYFPSFISSDLDIEMALILARRGLMQFALLNTVHFTFVNCYQLT